MHQPAPRPSFDLAFDVFVDELVGALAAIVPQTRVGRLEHGIRFVRGSATADVTMQRDDSAGVVLRHGCDRVVCARVPLTSTGLNDLAADLVGFFCGAPLLTLSIFPRVPIPPVANGRRRRRGNYEAPLITLPFEARARLR